MKYAPLRLTLGALLIGPGVLLGLEPFASHFGGWIAALSLIHLSRLLYKKSAKTKLFFSLLACLSVSIFAFPWLYGTIVTMGGLSALSAAVAFLLHSILANLKIPFMIFVADYLRRLRLPGLLFFPILAIAGDLIFWQLFPWYWGNLTVGSILMQSARIFGVYGAGALVFLEAGVLYTIAHPVWMRFVLRRKKNKTRAGGKSHPGNAKKKIRKRSQSTEAGIRAALRRRRAFVVGVMSIFIIIYFYVYGIVRLMAEEPYSEKVRIGFIQPGTRIALNEYRDDAQFASAALNNVFNLGLRTVFEGRGTIDLLILPESSVPFLGTNDTEENRQEHIYSTTYLAIIAFFARYGSLDVLYNELDQGSRAQRNLATIFGREGSRRDSYEKQHLVPFGEYLPFENALPVLRRLFPEASRYVAGSPGHLLEYRYRLHREEKPLPVPGEEEMRSLSDASGVLKNWPKVETSRTGKLASLICYEGMYPGLVRSFFSRQSPDFLVNIVNDSWFGISIENYQHLTASRFRAVETGRYFVRVSLSGITSVINTKGQPAMEETQAGKLAYGIFDVPRIPNETTPYLLLGDFPMYALLLLTGILAGWKKIALNLSRKK